MLLAVVWASLLGGAGAVFAAPASSAAPASVPPPMPMYTKDKAPPTPRLEDLPL